MTKTKLKICGITDADTLNHCNSNGVDFVGIVFTHSKRQLSITKAVSIISQLQSPNLKLVGVFKGESESFIRKSIKECSLDYVQLHGDMTYSDSFYADYKVIQAFSSQVIMADSSLDLSRYEYVLIDGPQPGSGQVFDWNSFKLKIDSSKVIIAGGINHTNILEALECFNPYAIDLSSGVELNGKKDKSMIDKIINIIGGYNELQLSRFKR